MRGVEKLGGLLEAAVKARSMALVFGEFSTLARARHWRDLDSFFNPKGIFREVHVVALADDYPYTNLRFGTLHIHPIRSLTRVRALSRINDVYTMLRGLVCLVRIAKTKRIDLVAQVDSTPIKFGLLAVLAGRMTGLPSVVTLCSDYDAALRLNSSLSVRWAAKLLWPYVLGRCTMVRSKGQYIAGFATGFGVPAEKMRVIPNKEGPEWFQSPPTELQLGAFRKRIGIDRIVQHSVVFLACARLIRIKNFARTLQAFEVAESRSGNLVLLIAGEGPLRQELERLAQELGLGRRVRFLGQLPHDDLRMLYHVSDVFLFPTLYEGQPRALLEAMLVGLPVVASNHGAVRELVTDRQDGRLVDPWSVEDIANAIEEVAADPKLREEYGRHRSFDPDAYSLSTVSWLEADLYLDAMGRFRAESGR